MTKKVLSAILASLVVAGVGCSHETESPKVTITDNGLTPNMVCSDNRIPALSTAPIVVAGTGFTPLPTKTLSDDKPTLWLPTIDLTRSGDLVTGAGPAGDGGTPAGDAGAGGVPVPTTGEDAIKYSGKPVAAGAADPDHSADLSWQSESQMTFNVTDGIAIRPGVYDVTVTNPDKKRKAVLEDSLAVVPPPVISQIVPPTICVDQADQTITMYGGFFARVDGTRMPKIDIGTVDAQGNFVVSQKTDGSPATYDPTSMDGCAAQAAQFNLDLCDSITFVLGMNDLPAGDYRVRVTDPDPLSCYSNADFAITVHAPPDVTSVVPNKVCTGGSILTVQGTGFFPGATAEIRCPNRPPVVSSQVVVSDQQNAVVTFDAAGASGLVTNVDCEFVFINADGCEDRPLPHETVQGTEGPILFNVDPNFVYSDMSTSVKLYLTAIAMNTPGAVPVVEIWPHGPRPATPQTLTATYAPNKTNVLQVTIPANMAVGAYDMQVDDDTDCNTIMDNAVTVTNNLVVTSGSVEPPFGDDSESVPITITLAADPGATGVPRAFLMPATGPGIQLSGVTTTSATTLTAVVPTGTLAGSYKIVIVWPDGKVAVVNSDVTDGGVTPVAYTSVANAPPVITDATPQTVVAQTGQVATITGTGFATDATVTFDCSNDNGVTVVSHVGTVTVAPTAGCNAACTMTATFDASTPGAGSICVVRVTNPTDGTYGSFSAIGVTNSSNNLPAGRPSQDLNLARRALVSAAVKATSASRFVYAIGGDDGTDANAMDSVEFAPVSVFGAVSPWVLNTMPNAPKLTSKRSYAGTATIGRYVYVLGGFDGAAALNTAERAMVLSPEETPTINNLDLCLTGPTADCYGLGASVPGLDPGVYSYRVAAVITPGDAQNVGGETLASDPMIVRLSSTSLTGRKVVVKIGWDTPKDPLGVTLTGISGYRIYRTPLAGTLPDGGAVTPNPGTNEMLLATVSGTTLEFNDDGSQTVGTEVPLPLGSTSAWGATPALSVNRQGPAGAAGMDPTDATKAYVYTLGGRDGATGQDSYEFLTVTKLPNGRQTLGAASTAPVMSIGGARWQTSGFSVTNTEASIVTVPDNFIYVGPGLDAAGASANIVTAGKVATGGDLGTFVTLTNPGGTYAGYGGCSIAGQLFTFGGQAFPPSKSVAVVAAPPTLSASWNAGLTVNQDRYLMGATIQSAVIFLVGGQTAAPALAASRSTETILF